LLLPAVSTLRDPSGCNYVAPVMRASDCLTYLFGQRQAIEAVARSRAALPTGIVLVFLTAIARNYDQTWLPENPFLWIFGSLLFSWVSGSVLYSVAWRGMLRRAAAEKLPEPPSMDGWVAFMGLFWLTAPIAWLYAIPVERFLDDVAAAKANVALLAVVALWRVLLMARVFQVLARAPFLLALLWVLVVASAEALVVFFFGGGFAKAIMAGMGGMRNSPAEDVLLGAMGTAFSGALLTFPVALISVLAWSKRYDLQPLPALTPAPLPWKPLLAAAVFWIAAAILPQRELAHTVTYERLLEAGQYRAALDYLNARQAGDFAPARTLPPRPYEREFFEQLPACFGKVQPTDPPWVRSHLMRRLDQMLSHYKHVADGLRRFGPDAGAILQLLDGLARIPEGETWLKANPVFLDGMRAATKENQPSFRRSKKTDAENASDWLLLSNRVRQLHGTNAAPASASPP
jgi:hypothetical protein